MQKSRIAPSDRIKILEKSFKTDINTVLPELDQEIIINSFESKAHENLPSEDAHIRKNPAFLALLKYYLTKSTAANREIFNSLKTPDKDIRENNSFSWPLLKPAGRESCKKAILLFHGLNERSWNKYLPWASLLAEETGSAVILFPTAFHMNRSPASWSDIRRMMPVTRERKTLLPDLEASSFANAAISYRMQFSPQRFILSGIQTFIDIITLVEKIRKGGIPGLSPEAGIDIFAYSIGATLAEVLIMANPRGYFSRSRAFLFCGGPALDLATPVNRVIIDNHAFFSLLQHFKNVLDGREEELVPAKSSAGSSGYKYLTSLMIYERMKEEREARLTEIQDRFLVSALLDDKTMRPEAMKKTFMETGITLDIEDFPYTYTHENPFPAGEENTVAVNRAMESVMGKAAVFFTE